MRGVYVFEPADLGEDFGPLPMSALPPPAAAQDAEGAAGDAGA